MKYEEISPTMREFIGNREALRKLGFPAEDLHLEVAMSVASQRVSGFLTLKHKGKEFSIELGPVNDDKAFGEEYRRLCDAINTRKVSQKDLDRIWHECMAFQDKTGLVGALLRKGLTPPAEARS